MFALKWFTHNKSVEALSQKQNPVMKRATMRQHHRSKPNIERKLGLDDTEIEIKQPLQWAWREKKTGIRLTKNRWPTFDLFPCLGKERLGSFLTLTPK